MGSKEKPLTMANTNKWHQWQLQSIQSEAAVMPQSIKSEKAPEGGEAFTDLDHRF